MKKILFFMTTIFTANLYAGVVPSIEANSDVVVADVDNSNIESESYAKCSGKAKCQTGAGLSVVQASGGSSKGIGIKSTVHVIDIKNSKVKAKATNECTGKSECQTAAGIAVSQKSD